MSQSAWSYGCISKRYLGCRFHVMDNVMSRFFLSRAYVSQVWLAQVSSSYYLWRQKYLRVRVYSFISLFLPSYFFCLFRNVKLMSCLTIDLLTFLLQQKDRRKIMPQSRIIWGKSNTFSANMQRCGNIVVRSQFCTTTT